MPSHYGKGSVSSDDEDEEEVADVEFWRLRLEDAQQEVDLWKGEWQKALKDTQVAKGREEELRETVVPKYDKLKLQLSEANGVRNKALKEAKDMRLRFRVLLGITDTCKEELEELSTIVRLDMERIAKKRAEGATEEGSTCEEIDDDDESADIDFDSTMPWCTTRNVNTMMIRPPNEVTRFLQRVSRPLVAEVIKEYENKMMEQELIAKEKVDKLNRRLLALQAHMERENQEHKTAITEMREAHTGKLTGLFEQTTQLERVVLDQGAVVQANQLQENELVKQLEESIKLMAEQKAQLQQKEVELVKAESERIAAHESKVQRLADLEVEAREYATRHEDNMTHLETKNMRLKQYIDQQVQSHIALTNQYNTEKEALESQIKDSLKIAEDAEKASATTVAQMQEIFTIQTEEIQQQCERQRTLAHKAGKDLVLCITKYNEAEEKHANDAKRIERMEMELARDLQRQKYLAHEFNALLNAVKQCTEITRPLPRPERDRQLSSLLTKAVRGTNAKLDTIGWAEEVGMNDSDTRQVELLEKKLALAVKRESEMRFRLEKLTERTMQSDNAITEANVMHVHENQQLLQKISVLEQEQAASHAASHPSGLAADPTYSSHTVPRSSSRVVRPRTAYSRRNISHKQQRPTSAFARPASAFSNRQYQRGQQHARTTPRPPSGTARSVSLGPTDGTRNDRTATTLTAGFFAHENNQRVASIPSHGHGPHLQFCEETSMQATSKFISPRVLKLKAQNEPVFHFKPTPIKVVVSPRSSRPSSPDDIFSPKDIRV